MIKTICNYLKGALFCLSSLVSFEALAQQACLFEHSYQGGYAVCLRPGQEYRDLRQVGFNDIASSLTMSQGLVVTVCEHIYFQGWCRDFTAPVSDFMYEGFNDRISSISVRWAGWGAPPPPPSYPPQHPGQQGPVARLIAEVPVGCKGRVERVEVTNFVVQNSYPDQLVFRASNRVAHKCGNNGTIGADVTVSVPRWSVNVNQNGVLLGPVANASIQCAASTSWSSGPCQNAYFQ